MKHLGLKLRLKLIRSLNFLTPNWLSLKRRFGGSGHRFGESDELGGLGGFDGPCGFGGFDGFDRFSGLGRFDGLGEFDKLADLVDSVDSADLTDSLGYL